MLFRAMPAYKLLTGEKKTIAFDSLACFPLPSILFLASCPMEYPKMPVFPISTIIR